LDTLDTGKDNQNTKHEIKKMNNTDPIKNRGWALVLSKGKQFLPIIRYPPCYLYRREGLDTTIRIQTQIA